MGIELMTPLQNLVRDRFLPPEFLPWLEALQEEGFVLVADVLAAAGAKAFLPPHFQHTLEALQAQLPEEVRGLQAMPPPAMGLDPTSRSCPPPELRRWSIEAGFQALPTSAWVEPALPGVRNQGTRGTCVACASIVLMEHFLREGPLSEQYAYYLFKEHDGHPGSGTYLDIAVGCYQAFGACQGSLWAYDPFPRAGKKEGQGPPPLGCRRDAARRKLPSAAALRGTGIVEQMKTALVGIRVGGVEIPARPLLVGLVLFESFFSFATSSTGRVIMKVPGERAVGAHALCVLGYRDGKEAGGGTFQVLNSWGETWGDGGLAHIPYAYFEQYLGDPTLYAFLSAEEAEALPPNQASNLSRRAAAGLSKPAPRPGRPIALCAAGLLGQGLMLALPSVSGLGLRALLATAAVGLGLFTATALSRLLDEFIPPKAAAPPLTKAGSPSAPPWRNA